MPANVATKDDRLDFNLPQRPGPRSTVTTDVVLVLCVACLVLPASYLLGASDLLARAAAFLARYNAEALLVLTIAAAPVLGILAFTRSVQLRHETAARYTAEDQLKDHAAMLAQAQRVAQIGSWDLDVASGSMTWSDELYRIYGVRPHEVRPDFDLLFSLVHPEDRKALADAVAEVVRNRLSFNIEHRIQRPDGEIRFVHARGLALSGGDGKPGRIVGTAQDITTRKKAEDAEKRAALKETEVMQLREVNAIKTQLLSTASHELKNPLTPLKLQLEMLKEGTLGDLNDQQRKAVQLLDRNLDRLAALVRDIVDLSRLESGRLKIRAEAVDLNDLVAEVVESYEPVAREAGVEMHAALQGGIRIEADPYRVSQVLTNLISNAIKFTPHGGRVTVETGEAAGLAGVRVMDTGVGLTREQMDKLFQPFSQVQGTEVEAKQGTGLGLYISKSLVENMNGRMWCESDGAGRGATFAFALPLKAALPEPPSRPKPKSGPTIPAKRKGPFG